MENVKPDSRSRRVRSVIFFLLKILLAGSIVYVLVSRQKEAVLECFKNFDYRYLLPAVVLYPLVTGGSIILSTLSGMIFYKERLTAFQLISVAVCFVGTLLFLF